MSKEKIVRSEKIFNWDELSEDDIELKYSMLFTTRLVRNEPYVFTKTYVDFRNKYSSFQAPIFNINPLVIKKPGPIYSLNYSVNYPISSCIKSVGDNKINKSTLKYREQKIIKELSKYPTTEIQLNIAGDDEDVYQMISEYLKWPSNYEINIELPTKAYEYFAEYKKQYTTELDNVSLKTKKIIDTTFKIDQGKTLKTYPYSNEYKEYGLFYYLLKTADTGKLYFNGSREEYDYSKNILGYRPLLIDLNNYFVKKLHEKKIVNIYGSIPNFEKQNLDYASSIDDETHTKKIREIILETKSSYEDDKVVFSKGNISNTKEYEIIEQYFRTMLIDLHLFRNGGIIFDHLHYVDMYARKMLATMSNTKNMEPDFAKKNIYNICLASLCAYIIWYIEFSKGKIELNENELVKSCMMSIKPGKDIKFTLTDFFVCIIEKKFTEEYHKLINEYGGNWKKLIIAILGDVHTTSKEGRKIKKSLYYEIIYKTYKWLARVSKYKKEGTYGEVENCVYNYIAYGKEYDITKINKIVNELSAKYISSKLFGIQKPEYTIPSISKYMDINPVIYCFSGNHHEWKLGVCKICGTKIVDAYNDLIKFDNKKYINLKNKVDEIDAITYYKYMCFDNTPHQIYYGYCENCGKSVDIINNPTGQYLKEIIKEYKISGSIEIYYPDTFIKLYEIPSSFKKEQIDIGKLDKLIEKMRKLQKYTIQVDQFKFSFLSLGIFQDKKTEDIDFATSVKRIEKSKSKSIYDDVYNINRYDVLYNCVDYLTCVFMIKNVNTNTYGGNIFDINDVDTPENTNEYENNGKNRNGNEYENNNIENDSKNMSGGNDIENKFISNIFNTYNDTDLKFGGATDLFKKKRKKTYEKKTYKSVTLNYDVVFMEKIQKKLSEIYRMDNDVINKLLNIILDIGNGLTSENDIYKFYTTFMLYYSFTDSYNITDYYIKSHGINESKRNELRHDVEMSLTPDFKTSVGFEYLSRNQKNALLDQILSDREKMYTEENEKAEIINAEDYSGETNNENDLDIAEEDEEGADVKIKSNEDDAEDDIYE